MSDIGLTIRNIRKNREMKLTEISEKTGLTISHISQIERGVANPSLSALEKLAEALEVPITLFFQEEKSKYNYVRANERRKIVMNDSSTFIEILANSEESDKLAFYYSQIMNDEVGKEVTSHEGEEFFYVLTGEMDFYLGTELIHLKPGDTLFFDASTPHKGLVVKKPFSMVIVTTRPTAFMNTLGRFIPGENNRG